VEWEAHLLRLCCSGPGKLQPERSSFQGSPRHADWIGGRPAFTNPTEIISRPSGPAASASVLWRSRTLKCVQGLQGGSSIRNATAGSPVDVSRIRKTCSRLATALLQMAANFRLGYGTAQRRKRQNGETIHSSSPTVLGQLASASLASECRQDLRINLE
jgi:hypothetical protein